MALSAESAGLKHGWRSGLEAQIAAHLTEQDIPFLYEKLTLLFVQPSKPRKYKPDFALLSNGIIVESKGRFVTADRQKHLLIQAQHPKLDIRFAFGYPKARISKQSKTTYAMWCDTHGFKYAKSTEKEPIPAAWLREPINASSLAEIRRLLRQE